jgi:hypothetical protein
MLKERNMHSTLFFLHDPITLARVIFYLPHSLSCLYFPRRWDRREGKRDRCLPKHYVQRPVISLSHPYSLGSPRSYPPFLTLVAKRAILQNPYNSTSVILDRFSRLRFRCTSCLYARLRRCRSANYLIPFSPTQMVPFIESSCHRDLFPAFEIDFSVGYLNKLTSGLLTDTRKLL